MSKLKSDRSKLRPATRIATAAKNYNEHGMVNPAVYHASTVTFPDMAALGSRKQEYIYARRGTPTSRAIEEAIAELEGGHACKVASSGLAAVTIALLAFLKAGDHLLMVDTVYAPVRHLCDDMLVGLGVETTYYDPLAGEKLRTLIKSNTKVVYLESPGSQTMEVMDVPLMVRITHEHGALAMIDNTWSAGHFFKAFDHGCDVSVQAATKYIVGHSDAMFGSVVCNEATWPRFKEIYELMGQFAGPDDMYLALRGLRTLDVRLERHMKSALKVAEWLRERPEVETVLHPGLSTHQAMLCGSVISPAHPACSHSSSSRQVTRPWPPCWMIWICSPWDLAGAGLKALWCPSRPTALQPNGRPQAPHSACILASSILMT